MGTTYLDLKMKALQRLKKQGVDLNSWKGGLRSWVPMDETFPSALDKFKKKQKELNGGFVSESDMSWIIEEDRLCKMLIRHSHGRLICAAQDVAFHIECIEKYKGDFAGRRGELPYVRDVSFIYEKEDK